MLVIHSYLRYIVLFFIIASIVKSIIGIKNDIKYTDNDKKLNSLAVIFSHLQLLIGLYLYFTSPTVKIALENMAEAMKSKELRFWSVEHISMMIIAITLITVGNAMAKRVNDSKAKYKKILIFFTLALIIIFIAIPWPWSAVSRQPF
jgi:hypothetical protein